MSTYAQRVQLGAFYLSGVIQGAAKLYHYEAGTSTLKNIWSTRTMGGGDTLAQPFVADADGVFNFFADGLYKLIICGPDSTGPSDDVLYTLDNWQLIDRTDPTFLEGSPIASSSAIAVGPEIWAHVTGTTNIDTITGTVPFVWLVFDGALRLNNSASLLCPDGFNLSVRAGEVVMLLNEGSNVWRVGSHFTPGKQTDIESATTITPPTAGSFVEITGTTTIEGIAASFTGHEFTARFTNSAGLNILHNATSMICPFATDYRVVQDEIVKFICISAAGYWMVVPIAGAPHLEPGMFLPGWFTTSAPTGGLIAAGAAINCTTYHALAKKLIPNAATLGNSATSVGTFTADAGSDVLTCTGHGLAVNDVVHVTTSAADLPLNLVINTPYYVRTVPTADTLTLSATRGGSLFDIGDAGTGVHTLHNKVNLPDTRGRGLVAIDNLGGSAASRLTSASLNGSNGTLLGGAGGAETHTLVASEAPVLNVRIETATGGSNPAVGSATASAVMSAFSNSASVNVGGGGAHNNMPPWVACGIAIRF